MPDAISTELPKHILRYAAANSLGEEEAEWAIEEHEKYQTMWDPVSGEYYYYNTETGETSWKIGGTQ